jgi:2-C-methyl-D-erythritol 4-phosphate cytidylyltransferase
MNVAIIAAGGRGARMGGVRAKQFLELAGTPIIVHTLRRFELCDAVAEIVAVVPAADVEALPGLAEQYGLRKLARVVAGGATRTQSVWLGLQAVSDGAASGVVAVHDAVRPFVTTAEIEAAVREAEKSGAAVLAARATDTIKEAEGHRVARTLDRARLWHAQTPQCFRHALLRRACEMALAERVEATDCSALVERLGHEVTIVEGGPHNIKITTPQDLALAEVLMKSGVRSQESE